MHLKNLANLKTLYLAGTQITDTGLVHLKGLTNLQNLFLPTKVTDAALATCSRRCPTAKSYGISPAAPPAAGAGP